MKLFSFALDPKNFQPETTFSAWESAPYSLFFDSADREHELGRYSFLCFLPIETIEAKNGYTTITNRDGQHKEEGNPFEILHDRIDHYGMNKRINEAFPPFQGGAAGYFGYDLARDLESLPAFTKDEGVPDMAVGIYDQLCAFDHEQNKAWYLTYADSPDHAQKRYDMFLSKSEVQNVPASTLSGWQNSVSSAEYEARVQRIIDYVYAGDIFQANLSQRFHTEIEPGFSAYGHYLSLREANPAPFGAFMNFGSIKLASASPERFINHYGRIAETRPIKGTIKRYADPEHDQDQKDMLASSDKDRAENVMIVDLLRNDLSKVCEDHSVRVTRLNHLESFAHVHHLVSTVEGVIRADKSAVSLLEACFPGGSITGAPKVRAMEIIEELEDTRRGPYCGSMGYIGFDGTMDTNIIIRTLVYNGNTVSLNVGGGITAASDPASEYMETLHKALGFFGGDITIEKEDSDSKKRA